MRLIKTDLDGVSILKPIVHEDNRGFFFESFNKKIFESVGLDFEFIQDNHSFSMKSGTLRGLHYQSKPFETTKMLRVTRGSILEVVVDIRSGSPNYGKWISLQISDENKIQIIVPCGFAHGFCTLEDNTEVLYKVDQHYSPEHDMGIRWDDPELAIDWPTSRPILSERDRKLPLLREQDNNFTFVG